jgi:hypothetical protein
MKNRISSIFSSVNEIGGQVNLEDITNHYSKCWFQMLIKQGNSQ